MTSKETSGSGLAASLSYDDAPAAIAWLGRALGFELRLLVEGPEGSVRHSELSHGNAVVMVSSARPEEGRLSPLRLPGVPQTLCLRVADPDAWFERAQEAGARIVQEIRKEEHGARGFLAKDPEGHLWYVSDYRPGAHWNLGTETAS